MLIRLFSIVFDFSLGLFALLIVFLGLLLPCFWLFILLHICLYSILSWHSFLVDVWCILIQLYRSQCLLLVNFVISIQSILNISDFPLRRCFLLLLWTEDIIVSHSMLRLFRRAHLASPNNALHLQCLLNELHHCHVIFILVLATFGLLKIEWILWHIVPLLTPLLNQCFPVLILDQTFLVAYDP